MTMLFRPPATPVQVRVLLCDGDELGADIVTAMLAAAGYAVERVRTARELLDTLAQRLPDVLLLAALTPVLDGGSLMRMLRQRPDTGNLPMLLMVPSEDADAATGHTIGQPFAADEIVERINRLMREHAR